MKTQLLEDIGQSAPLQLVPSGGISNSKPQKAAPELALARAAPPVRQRSATGVWRQKPAAEPVVVPTQQPDQQPPLEEPSLSELIAAVEAQLGLPQPEQEEAIAQAEPVLVASAPPAEPAPQDPVFDFTPATPATPDADVFKHEASWFERSGQRYLMWGSCVLLALLAIQAGLWFYQERKDESALALVADEVKTAPQANKGVAPRTLAANEVPRAPDGEAPVTPAASAASPSPVPVNAQPVPPMVLLAPGTKIEPMAALPASREERQAPPKAEPVAEQTPVARSAPRVRRTEREPVVAAAKPAQARTERAPERQSARTPAVLAESNSGSDSTMTATLKACRQHGYDAAKCVKRACSVTKYGFFCRGK